MGILSIDHLFLNAPLDQKNVKKVEEVKEVLACTRFTLTDEQRNKITSISFKRYLKDYLKDHIRYNQFEKDVEDDARPMKVAGAVGGAAVGGVLLGGAVALACPHPAPIVAGGVVGVVGGGLCGWHLAEAYATPKARAALKKKLRNSIEFRLWKNEQYKEVFPLLARALSEGERVRHENSLRCPLTSQWMREPVMTDGGRVYEKSEIEVLLQQWKATRPEESLDQLSSEEKENALRDPSPSGIYSIDRLIPRNNHYDEIFQKLKDHYNAQILQQRHILENVAALEQPVSEEVQKIVNFYSKTREERTDLIEEMRIAVIKQRLQDAEEFQITSLLRAALEPPILLA